MSSVGTIYPANFIPGLDLGNVIAETLFKNSQGSTALLTVPSDGQLDKNRFILHLGGRVQTTSNLNFTLAVYFGTSSVIASNTQVYTSNAVTVNTKKTNWHVDINCFWDSDSRTLCGHLLGQMANGILGPATLTNSPSADPNLHNTFPGSSLTNAFTVTGLFSGSSSGNHAFIDVFSLELL